MWSKKSVLFVCLAVSMTMVASRAPIRRHRDYSRHDTSIRDRCKLCNIHTLDAVPVCGTDGNTYLSACFLRITACMEADPMLQLRHRGKCRPGYRWYHEEDDDDEDEDDEDSSELANERTSSDSSQFGHSASHYGDRSETRDEADDGMQSLFTTVAPFDKDMNDPGNICPHYCPISGMEEVCGTDGITYVSACFLELAACQPDGNSNLRTAYKGHCKSRVPPTTLSEGITSESGLGDAIVAELSDTDCCPLQLYAPVCALVGTQEITFRSKCEIECLYMQRSLGILIIKQGNCDDRFALQGLQSYPLTCGNVIDYDVNDVTSYAPYLSQLMQLYDDYMPIRQKGVYKNCAEGSTQQKQFGRLCKFKQRQFGSWCSPANSFGYASGQPCIMLQLTKVSKWIPMNYNKKPPKKIARHHRTNYITVTCNEIVDRKRRLNSTKIYPKNGFGFHHFPYMETERWPYQRQYLSPAVLVRIVPRKLNFNFRIKCRAWAKNIDHATGMYAEKYQAQAIIEFSIKNDILQYKMSRL
ncbi:uncharacterized protein [Antedon mediterranea]|uniref:uncharacterized protein n=1 Tax=Antedon mediterranea TaxID=105859 RepID=UPI003AF67119